MVAIIDVTDCDHQRPCMDTTQRHDNPTTSESTPLEHPSEALGFNSLDASGRASGRLSRRHVGPSNLSWPESGKRVDQTEPQNSHQQTIQTDTDLCVESKKQRSGLYVDL